MAGICPKAALNQVYTQPLVLTLSGHSPKRQVDMTESGKIPWKRVLIEMAAIVVSILLAFSIDAWWEDRQRQIEERSILMSLHSETKALVQAIEENEIYVDALRDANRRTYNASVSTDIEISDAQIDQHLLEISWYIDPSNTNAPVLESIVKGGDLDVLSSSELRRRMASAMTWLDGYKQSTTRDADFYSGEFLPFIQAHASLGQIYIAEGHDPGFPDRTYPSYNIVPADEYSSNRDLFENHQFRNFLLHRMTTTTNILRWHESYLEPELQAVVTLVEDELKMQQSVEVDDN